MDLLTILFGVIAALVGGFFYQKSKKDSAEALLQNQDTKKALNELDKTVAKNDGLLTAEEEKRKQLEKDLEAEKAKDVSQKDLTDFFNNRK